MGTLATSAIEVTDRASLRVARREVMPVEGITRLASSLFRKRPASGAPALGKALLITSPTRREGVSTITRLLASHLADKGQRVLKLTPEDLNHAEEYALEQVDFLLTRGTTDSVWSLLREPATKFSFVAQARMTHGTRADILNHFRKQFDCILLDAPSVSHASERAEETLQACTLADGVLMVVAAGRSSRTEIRDAQQSILGVGGKIEGCCLNRRRQWIPTFLQRWFGR